MLRECILLIKITLKSVPGTIKYWITLLKEKTGAFDDVQTNGW